MKTIDKIKEAFTDKYVHSVHVFWMDEQGYADAWREFTRKELEDDKIIAYIKDNDIDLTPKIIKTI